MIGRIAHPTVRQDWLGEWTYAHRGLHHDDVTENSPAAFDGAIRAGLGIECDVQASRDGEAMVFHDWTLDRLTSESGSLRDRSAKELAGVALHSGGTIPRLSDLLAQIGGRVPLLVEVKSKRGMAWKPLARSVARALSGYNGAAAVMSFDPRIVRWFSYHLSGRPRGLVTGRGEKTRLAFAVERAVSVAHARPTFLACDIRDLPDPALARYRERGLPLLTWTVRSRALMARARLHADAAIAEGAGLA
ncbi:glycerophosphodiester phosphodiesterase family protein [Croceicoccus naphthovorans]|uniref:glycerophosphodiester phosphodiesterase family protein n=1 Tax=Croceicoccus naphthovorans TaxID=1348774 RepID=UPI000ADF72CD|nr:glycerophosphodiester phosphodiesterase family protein [Croceicoccus naphthovorans]MBB3990203.1 glycerophosphoryl diester phosphodiesterase [Croceicoccus naphthovorans]